MPTIRREDKEIIHNLSLLGMLFGAIVGGFLVLHSHRQAQGRYDIETAAVQTHSSLERLSSNLTAAEISVAQAAMGQVVGTDAEAAPDGVNPVEKSFWIDLPQWGLWGICGAAALAGAGTGYLSLWGAGWFGSLLTYWLIRVIYRVIRKTAPDSIAAQRPLSTAGMLESYQRDEGRLLPTLVKLFMLLAMALGVLAIVVWQLTAM